ncbi:hypothetical protein ACWIEX_11995 [Bosea sp. NPDC055353]
MDKLASLVIRLSQISIEFGEEVGSRAIYAASVAAAHVVLEEAEAEARAASAQTATIITFPVIVCGPPDQDKEPRM